MTIKTILAPLFDSALDTVVVDAAAKLAIQFNAHLETLLLRVSVNVASEFISKGFRNKALHRLILTSSTYRMASTPTEAGRKNDPGNQLFSHFPMRRLTAEEVRDSVLAVTGELNLKMGGPSVRPPMPEAAPDRSTAR